MDKICNKCKIPLPIEEFKVKCSEDVYTTSDTCENCLEKKLVCKSVWGKGKLKRTVKKINKPVDSGLSNTEKESVLRLIEGGMTKRTIRKMFDINQKQLKSIL